jgi:hypothetical protein
LADTGLNHKQIAVRLGDVDETSVRRGLERAKLNGWTPPVLREPSPIILERSVEYVLSDSGALAVTADFHFPLTDYPFLNTFLRTCSANGIKNLAIAGDFWNMDALSRFEYKQDNANMQTELARGNEAMIAMLEQFDQVIFIWGNHDARFHKAMGYKVDFKTAMKMAFHDVPDKLFDKMTISNLDHFKVRAFPYADVGEDTWYICHPKSYSRTPLMGAIKIAAVKQMNVLTAHSHHHAYGHDASGRFVVGEVGGFFDRHKVEYLNRTEGFPHWQQGYAILTEDNDLIMRGRKVRYEPAP